MGGGLDGSAGGRILMLSMRRFLPFLLLLAPGFADEAPKPADAEPQKVRPGEVEPGERGTRIEDPAVARDKVARFEAELKAADGERAEAELVRKLGDWDHPEILKALARRLSDRNRFVAIEAALACARQSEVAKAGSAVHRALQSERRPDVVCAQLVALGKLEYA